MVGTARTFVIRYEIKNVTNLTCPSCGSVMPRVTVVQLLIRKQPCPNCGALIFGDLEYSKNFSIWTAIFFLSITNGFSFIQKDWFVFTTNLLGLLACLYDALKRVRISR